jgi:hypothetical protein
VTNEISKSYAAVGGTRTIDPQLTFGREQSGR